MSRYLFLVLGLAISVANASEQSPSKTTEQISMTSPTAWAQASVNACARRSLTCRSRR